MKKSAMNVADAIKQEETNGKNKAKPGKLNLCLMMLMMSISLISEQLKIKQFKIGYKSSIYYRLFIYYYYMSKAFSLLFTLFILVLVHSEDCCNNEVVSVIGSGAVSVDPDIASFYIYAVANGKTSVQALSNVNNLINQVTKAI